MNIQLINLNNTDQIDQQKAILSDEERARAARFLRELDARSYIVSHAELRRILAKSLNCAPQDVKIAADQHGKPYLPDAEHIHFNLSHAGDYALVAVSQAGPLGVDIEKVNSKADCLAIAERFFTEEECSYIVSSRTQLDAFFRVWTLKEAYVKAIGRGLAYGMDRFSVISADSHLVSEVEDYQLQSVDVPHGYYGAVAFKTNN